MQKKEKEKVVIKAAFSLQNKTNSFHLANTTDIWDPTVIFGGKMAPRVKQTSAEMFGYLSAVSSRYGSIMEKRPMHRGVMTQAVLAVKQWHMAKLHNIKHFGGRASPVPKQHSDLANKPSRSVTDPMHLDTKLGFSSPHFRWTDKTLAKERHMSGYP